MNIEEFLNLFFNLLFKAGTNRHITLKNSPLVSIKIDKKIDRKRYELFINSKKNICISHKELEVSKNYWCIISKDTDGVIILSNLHKQPDFFQNNTFFSFDIPFKRIIENLKIKNFKQYYTDILYSQKNINKNMINKFIFCLQKNILSYPLFFNGEKMLLQFKIINQNLNEKSVQYYFAFKNYGGFEGEIRKNSQILLVSNYNNIIDIKIYSDIIFIKKNKIEPLCEISENILDLKG